MITKAKAPLAPTRARKPKPPLEREVQKAVVAYLRAAGWSVWQTSQGYRAPNGTKGLRFTPGIPDLYCVHPRWGALWVEVKRMGGELSPVQAQFGALHDTNMDVPDWVVIHSLQELIDYIT